MAFTFDSTPKSPTANSYISVERADELASGNVHGGDWLSLTDIQKQALLVQSTTRLDAESYGGDPTTTTNTIPVEHQALQWPRNGIIDRNYASGGMMYLDKDNIPSKMEQATFYLAMFYLDEFLENPTVSRQDMDRLTSLSIGPLTMSIQQRSEEKLPDLVTRMLHAIGSNAWMSSTPGVNPPMIKLVR